MLEVFFRKLSLNFKLKFLLCHIWLVAKCFFQYQLIVSRWRYHNDCLSVLSFNVCLYDCGFLFSLLFHLLAFFSFLSFSLSTILFFVFFSHRITFSVFLSFHVLIEPVSAFVFNFVFGWACFRRSRDMNSSHNSSNNNVSNSHNNSNDHWSGYAHNFVSLDQIDFQTNFGDFKLHLVCCSREEKKITRQNWLWHWLETWTDGRNILNEHLAVPEND